MSFLEKIRKKPEKTRKRILFFFTIITIIFLIIGFFLSVKYNLSRINFSNFPRPSFERDYLREIKEKLEKEKENLKGAKEKIEESEKNLKNLIPPASPSLPSISPALPNNK